MGVDWILAKAKKLLAKVEEFPNKLEIFRDSFTDKQRDYLANILAVTGGGIIFTAWEETFPIRQELTRMKVIEIMTAAILSLILVLGGLWLHGNRRGNGLNNIHSD